MSENIEGKMTADEANEIAVETVNEIARTTFADVPQEYLLLKREPAKADETYMNINKNKNFTDYEKEVIITKKVN